MSSELINYTAYIAGWWKLWTDIAWWLQGVVGDISIGSTKHNRDHVIWNLLNVKKPSFLVIVTTYEGVRKALCDSQLHDIPTIVASTWYHANILLWNRIPILQAPNLALPVVSLMKIFSDFKDFSGMNMIVHESHQPWKKDPSGTAMKVIEGFTKKGGTCEVRNEGNYHPDEGMSDLWGLITHRWSASYYNMDVPDESLKGHAYHRYNISGSGENFERFKELISKWADTYGNSENWDLQCYFESQDGKFDFWHDIDGHWPYSDGLKELLPWFLEQKKWLYQVVDYIKK